MSPGERAASGGVVQRADEEREGVLDVVDQVDEGTVEGDDLRFFQIEIAAVVQKNAGDRRRPRALLADLDKGLVQDPGDIELARIVDPREVRRFAERVGHPEFF